MYSFIWFIVFMFLLLIEFLTINLVTIWFVIGSLAALIASYFTDSLIIQIIVFVVFSVITVFFTRPIMRKFKGISLISDYSDKLIGMEGVMVKRVAPRNHGEIKVFGGIWTVRSKDIIEVGETAKITGIDGEKLIVTKVK